MAPTRSAPGEYGNGSLYQRSSDGRWIGTLEAGYTKNGARRRVTVTAKTEVECKRKLRDKRSQIAKDGQATASNRMTVKAWSDKWLERIVLKERPKSYTTDRGAVRAWIVPTIGHKRLDQVEPDDVRAVAAAVRRAGLNTSTARRYQGVLIRMLKAAVQDGHSIAGRVLTTEMPTEAVTDRTALALPEALDVLEVVSYMPHGSRWVAALLQGMRQGECLGLTWPEVDLEAGYLTVSWQLQALPYLDPKNRRLGFRVPDGYEARQVDRSIHLVRPKSKAGWRVIPLVPWMRDSLAAWQQTAPLSPAGLVWPNTQGGPANIRHDTDEWNTIQDTAGVRHPSGRHYYGHEARNTAATLLLELDVPESVRIAILGHSSIQTTRGYEVVARAQALAALSKAAERLQLR